MKNNERRAMLGEWMDKKFNEELGIYECCGTCMRFKSDGEVEYCGGEKGIVTENNNCRMWKLRDGIPGRKGMQ